MLHRNSFIFQPFTHELLIVAIEKVKFDKNLFRFYLCYFAKAFVYILYTYITYYIYIILYCTSKKKI